VLLDSFGTLVSMEPPAPRMRAALARVGVEVSEERADQAFRAEIRYYLAHHVEGSDERSLSALRDSCADVLRHALGHPELDLAAARAAMLDAIRFQPFPDSAPALRELRSRGLKLVVASNWDCSLPDVLERAGLASLVDGVVASAVVGADKPAPAVFEAALAVAGCAPDRAVHVGDSIEKDVAGAEAAGIRAVLIDRDGRSAHGGGAVIASLAELPRVI
jgi:putative hydrolase of the HAD superfamily